MAISEKEKRASVCLFSVVYFYYGQILLTVTNVYCLDHCPMSFFSPGIFHIKTLLK